MVPRPPLKSSKTSLAVFSLYYAERLGHHIWWQPPSYFSTFIAMIRPFIDPKTMAKVVLINGDTSPGSPNDQKLVAIIGPDWREKTGAEGTRETPKSSPGYIHAKYWKEALDEDAALAEARNCKTPTRSHTEEAPPSPPDHKVSRDTSDIDHYFQAVKGGDEGTVRSLLSSGQIDPISCTNYVCIPCRIDTLWCNLHPPFSPTTLRMAGQDFTWQHELGCRILFGSCLIMALRAMPAQRLFRMESWTTDSFSLIYSFAARYDTPYGCRGFRSCRCCQPACYQWSIRQCE